MREQDFGRARLSHGLPAIGSGDKAFLKRCPRTYEVLCGRKFHLPNYRQADYLRQDLMDELALNHILNYGLGAFGYRDDVANIHYTSVCSLLRFGKPVFYLERELGEVFIRSQLPLTMQAADIEWKLPAFRVMLPLGLLTIQINGEARSVLYLDICKLNAKEEIKLPRSFADELSEFIYPLLPYQDRYPITERRVFHKLGGFYPWDGFSVAGPVNYGFEAYSPELDAAKIMTYAAMLPWEGSELGQILALEGGLASPDTCDDADNLLLTRMRHLALNILLFLSQLPLEYDPARLKVLRKLKHEGKRLIPELAEAKFIGASMIRPKVLAAAINGSSASALPGASTGNHPSAHGVAGHWKRQPYGPKQGLRKWIFIHPYFTGDWDPNAEKTAK